MVMRRVIAGVKGKGRNRGDIIELTPDKKAALAVKEALAKQEIWPGKMAFGTSISFSGEIVQRPKGDLLKERYQHNNYKVSGTLTVHLRDAAHDTIGEPASKKFTIEFCDCLDREGIPDLTVNRFTVR